MLINTHRLDKKIFKHFLFILLFYIYTISIFGLDVPVGVFPLKNYPQDVDRWLSPKDRAYHTPLMPLSYQQARLKELYRHLYATDNQALSPWGENFVTAILKKNPGVLATQTDTLEKFSNTNKSKTHLGYGENFRVYPKEWINKITIKMQLSQFDTPILYNAKNRAIIVKNTHARLLPTHDPYFYSMEFPGQGYPFDILQASALWVGTPIYKIGETKDRAWALVMTPSFISWVENDVIALVTNSFIKRWQKLAKTQLMAITQTQTPILNKHKIYQYSAYIGTVFPLIHQDNAYTKIAIPQKTASGTAKIGAAWVNNEAIAKMPIPATPANFARLLKSLQNRPYGWGNMYFYNDCSAELSSLYTPFGFWLPRNASQQSITGKTVNLTAKSDTDRLNYLTEKGRPLTTIVYIGGHVFMYIGNYSDARNSTGAPTAMTYQAIWGLSPPDLNRRAVIGQSTFLPLLPVYPEDTALRPLNQGKFFNVFYLDEWPDSPNDYTTIFFGSSGISGQFPENSIAQ